MTRTWIIVLFAFALCLASCQTTTVIPIDDVYYWDKHESKTQVVQSSPNTQNTQNTQTTPNTPTTPKLEYLNVQDTTITVRIKK